MGETERVCIWFECDDEGYPKDSSLERMRAAGLTLEQADAFLLHDFPAICEGIACCSYSAEDVDGSKRITFATGGWSGAEDLIDAMLNQFWIKYRHIEWKRGGLFVFEVPARPQGERG